MENYDKLIEACRQKIDNGENIEAILGFLRNNGCYKGQCIYILLKIKYLPPEKIQFTKHLVYFSKTWADCREADEQWHEKLIKFLDNSDLSAI